MKRAMYSMEIKVERDKTTGKTRVLSSHTKLPVDCSHGGVKVYEDEQKVVHEVNGQDGVHLLSATEVEELILKAEQAADKVAEQEAVWEAEQVAMREAELAADKAAVQAAEQEAERVTNKAAERATHQAAIALLAKSRQSQEFTMASGGEAVLVYQCELGQNPGLQVSVEAERIPIREGNMSPSGGGAEPEAAEPPPTKHESLGEKKACMCCSAM
ncbi:paralemmin-1 [Syngnathus scovelli]|uniref:paralemmin-1 n=1 Tax=Syngnathus scovelli TaxID=161590 RepID=UPI00210FDBA6|nr:paralemmin-1 [Syngnathus scovelli]XP_049587580.1 paralemmin-1 [Syngnathus scovelli]